MHLSMEPWKGMSRAEREATARRLASELPSGFSFEAVQAFAQGGIGHDVALFGFERSRFALIPGGLVTIGFDADGDWTPTLDEMRSWRETAASYDIAVSIRKHVRAATLPRRQIGLGAFLIERTAPEVGWASVSLDEAAVRKILREYPAGQQVEVGSGKETLRIRRMRDGVVTAERATGEGHAELAENLRAAGFRFPTPDEWEYACGCGAPTLFRWGDHIPCDRDPYDASPKDAAPWNHHREPNAFGLHIAEDPYKYELTADIGITRGGDGGGMICGGAGNFISWLTLATAYFEEHACKHDPSVPLQPGYMIGRRVLPLG